MRQVDAGMLNESGPLESVREVALSTRRACQAKDPGGPFSGARTMLLLAVNLTEQVLLSAIFGPMSLILRGC